MKPFMRCIVIRWTVFFLRLISNGYNVHFLSVQVGFDLGPPPRLPKPPQVIDEGFHLQLAPFPHPLRVVNKGRFAPERNLMLRIVVSSPDES
jgi:hypothetical protein